MNDDKIVTLLSFESTVAATNKASVVASMLESMGIDVELTGDISSNMIPMTGNVVRILVNEKDVDRAREILRAQFDKQELKAMNID